MQILQIVLILEILAHLVTGSTCDKDPKRKACHLTGVRILEIDKHIEILDFHKRKVFFHNGLVRFLPIIKTDGSEVIIRHFAIVSSCTTNLTSDFFGSNAEHLKSFQSFENDLTIDENAFQYVYNLEKLTLPYNNIGKIPPKTFQGLTRLKNLDLSYNLLEFVDQKWFSSDLQRLSNVNLSNNLIKEIQKTSFDLLPYLRILDLVNNICTGSKFENKTFLQINQDIAHCYPCRIPTIKNGFVVDTTDNEKLVAESYWSDLSFLKVNCTKGVYLITERAEQTENFCINGEWRDRWASCQSELFCKNLELFIKIIINSRPLLLERHQPQICRAILQNKRPKLLLYRKYLC